MTDSKKPKLTEAEKEVLREHFLRSSEQKTRLSTPQGKQNPKRKKFSPEALPNLDPSLRIQVASSGLVCDLREPLLLYLCRSGTPLIYHLWKNRI